MRSGGAIGDVAAGWTLAGVGDIDRDGTADLIWYNASLGKANYWLLNADGTKRSGVTIGTAAVGWTLAATGEINADGTADLIWHNPADGVIMKLFLDHYVEAAVGP
jgi:hypothetical protein